MLILKVEHSKTYIQNATNQDLNLIREALTVFKKKYNPSPFAEQEWDVTYLLNTKNFSFPTAYLNEVKSFAKKQLIEVTEIDNRRYPFQTLPKLELRQDLPLRDDQKKAYELIKNSNTGIIMMPTASGKSRVIIKTIDFRKVRTLIIVPKTNLQDAMSRQLKEAFGNSRVDTKMPMELVQKMNSGFSSMRDDEDDVFIEDHALRKKMIKLDDEIYKVKEKGQKKSNLFDEVSKTPPSKLKITIDMDALGKNEEDINPEEAYIKNKKQKKWEKQKTKRKEYFENRYKNQKERKIKYKDIYVFCDKSLENMPAEFLNQFQMIIIDECHHAAARLIREALLRLKNAAYRYYFSATPWRDHPAEDKLLASAIGGEVIYELPPEEAIRYQSIAKPEFFMESSPEPSNFMKDKRMWRDVLEFGIIGNSNRNAKIVEDAIKDLDSGDNVFIAVDEISHLEMLKERFKKQGIDVDIIHGEIPRKVNEETIKKVGERTSGICIGTMSVGEGTDMPNISSVIIASGGKSSIRFLQRIGRGARKGTEQNKTTFKVRDYFDWFHDKLMRHSMIRKDIFNKYFKNYGE